jgi:hypothetical protein
MLQTHSVGYAPDFNGIPYYLKFIETQILNKTGYHRLSFCQPVFLLFSKSPFFESAGEVNAAGDKTDSRSRETGKQFLEFNTEKE